MAAFTKASIADIRDVAPDFGHERIGEARFATAALECADTGLVIHRLRPNTRQAFGHRHELAEEVCLVLGGSGRVRLDDQIVDLTERDLLRIAPAVARRFEAGPQGLEFVVFGPRHAGDGELLPDFWAEDA